jgi:hypothetical protein
MVDFGSECVNILDQVTDNIKAVRRPLALINMLFQTKPDIQLNKIIYTNFHHCKHHVTDIPQICQVQPLM